MIRNAANSSTNFAARDNAVTIARIVRDADLHLADRVCDLVSALGRVIYLTG